MTYNIVLRLCMVDVRICRKTTQSQAVIHLVESIIYFSVIHYIQFLSSLRTDKVFWYLMILAGQIQDPDSQVYIEVWSLICNGIW